MLHEPELQFENQIMKNHHTEINEKMSNDNDEC